MATKTIVCLRGGELAGRHDTSRSNTPPEVLRIGQGEPGQEISGYLVQTISPFGDRIVIHAIAIELIERALRSEERERQRADRGPWRLFAARG